MYSEYHRGNIRRKYTRIYVRIAADDATSVVRKRLRIRIHYAGDAYRKFDVSKIGTVTRHGITQISVLSPDSFNTTVQ